jgi:glycosidase
VWGDLTYEDETTHPFGRPRPRNAVEPDTALYRVYADLIDLRKRHLRLFVDGTLTWLLTDDARRLVAYERVLGTERAIAVFNASDEPHEVSLAADGAYRLVYPAGGDGSVGDGMLTAQLPSRSARVWVRE